MEALKHLKLAFFCLRKHECDDAIALLKALPSLAARSKKVTDVLRDVTAQMHYMYSANTGMTMKALASIKTTFENVLAYFGRLENVIDSDSTDMLDVACELAAEGDVDFLVEEMTEEWCRWLTLAKTNYTAMCGMDDVKTTVHRIMSTLPNRSAPALGGFEVSFKHLHSGY
ncbi:hypothetical protein SPRG_19642 [Saprolegnia parasitica CBS 223.65]|uniref:Uncharacterized protein n=1 Tax=Saprolegnia parasitica (strain CBS 223.65) TaxID=695850 RepID=A0A067CIR6_SAPPC|nr:hypothetical protein SPRG_19642 [Saprolegnia parasitica CBS 223.65]KDO30418.1 hypothetical protein SPRG_19642 [Saprolegnia parasitica CBS 223.65]|eukprot:XP_012198872.1 hypothetical protein SPRG_19642 [Saprolegnia parasitica CBS 223.65]